MVRLLVRSTVALLMLSVSTPVWAAGKAEPTAPSAAVAAAWAQEAKSERTSSTLKALYGAYGAVQTLDMLSTIQARNRGAREANPLMAGSYGQAAATKALYVGATVAALRLLEKKNRKAALVTMVALNLASGAVVANNYRNAHRLSAR
jgi:hypothetical protein